MELDELLAAEGVDADIDQVVAWARARAHDVTSRGLEAELAGLLGSREIVVARSGGGVGRSSRPGADQTAPGVPLPSPTPPSGGVLRERVAFAHGPIDVPIASEQPPPSWVETAPRFAIELAAPQEPAAAAAALASEMPGVSELLDIPGRTGTTLVSTEAPQSEAQDVEDLELLDEEDLELVEEEEEEGPEAGGDAGANGDGQEVPEWQRALVDAQAVESESPSRTVTEPQTVVPGPPPSDADDGDDGNDGNGDDAPA